MKRKLSALLLSCALLVGSAGAAFTPARTYTPGQFTDVAANAWYAASVQKVYELNLMNGSSATTFNPSGMFTVAEALTVAARMHSLSHGGSGSLPAASGAWYQGAVDYCLQNKLITGGQFDSYTRAATRAEMAGVIRAALPDDQWKAINSVSALPDVNMGNEYAQAIFDLYNAGVFTGSDDYGMFQPYAYITRAEVAAIVARCADPSQRKTLSLKPLSQREAPELLGGYQSNCKMSNGRLAYQDPTTKKWGYLDGNGAAVIPAQYDRVNAFESGYAKVEKNNKCGLINTSGVAVVPVEQDRLIHADEQSYDPATWFATKNGKTAIVNNGCLVTGYIYDSIKSLGGFYGVCQNDKWGVVNSAGGLIVPIQFPKPRYGDAVLFNGVYGLGCPAEGGVDVYDLNGALLGHFAEGCYYAIDNPLLAVKEGNKYAVVVGGKKITEAVYDRVTPEAGRPYTTVYYGDLTGLVGLNGELVAPGTYDDYTFTGDYFAARKKTGDSSYQVAVGDATGVLYTGTYPNNKYGRLLLSIYDTGAFYCQMYYHSDIRHDGVLFTEDGLSRKAEYNRGFGFHWKDDDGEYIMTPAGKVFGPRDSYTSYNNFYLDGDKIGIWDGRGELSEPIYDSRKEAEKAYKDYKANPEQERKEYDIRTNSAGKPIVTYGSSTVIEYYKNNMYYDEIQELGEGYYACRFNTTWYLLHA